MALLFCWSSRALRTPALAPLTLLCSAAVPVLVDLPALAPMASASALWRHQSRGPATGGLAAERSLKRGGCAVARLQLVEFGKLCLSSISRVRASSSDRRRQVLGLPVSSSLVLRASTRASMRSSMAPLSWRRDLRRCTSMS